MDVRGGKIYSKSEVDRLFDNSREEQLCINLIGETNWSLGGIYDTFENSNKRESPEPYINEAVITSMVLTGGSTASLTYGFTSETFSSADFGIIKKIVLISELDNLLGGQILIKVSVNNGVNYTDIVDTSIALDARNEEISIPTGQTGNQVKVKIEITNSITNTKPTVNFYGVAVGNREV